MIFNGFIVGAGATKSLISSLHKKIKVKAILLALRNAKENGFSRILMLSDAFEIASAISTKKKKTVGRSMVWTTGCSI